MIKIFMLQYTKKKVINIKQSKKDIKVNYIIRHNREYCIDLRLKQMVSAFVVFGFGKYSKVDAKSKYVWIAYEGEWLT